MDKGYLQFGEGTKGPFYTVGVPIKNEGADNWFALYESRWRKVHMQVKRLYIVVYGEHVTIQIDGV